MQSAKCSVLKILVGCLVLCAQPAEAELVSINSGEISSNAAFVNPDMSDGGIGLSVVSAGAIVTKTYKYTVIKNGLVSTTGINDQDDKKIFANNSGQITAAGDYTAIWPIDSVPVSLATTACGVCITIVGNSSEQD